MDRVRDFVPLYRPQICLAPGEIVADAMPAASYLGPPRELVRGGTIEIKPNGAAIAGKPLSSERPARSAPPSSRGCVTRRYHALSFQWIVARSIVF